MFFLTVSLFKKPKETDESLTIFFVSVLSSTLPIMVAYASEFLPFSVRNVTYAGQLYTVTVIDYSFVTLGKILYVLIMPFYLVAVFSLGKRLTVLPEAMSLQTNALYRFSRHPIYFAYIYWYIVQNFIFQSWAVLILSMFQILLVIIRARYEEKILERNFPEYGEYRKRVWWIGKNIFRCS